MDITLITARPIDFLQAQFMHRFGYTVGLHLWQEDGYNFFRCFFEGERKQPSLKEIKCFQEQVAEITAAFIIERWEFFILESLLTDEYEGLDKSAVADICQRAQGILDQGENSFSQAQRRRKEIIYNRLLKYFQTNSYLNVEGFIRFRLQDYFMELERALEEAIDEYLMEKEYDEFIRLLRYFVEAQEPQLERVHVLLSPGGRFQLYDHKNRNLSDEFVEGFLINMADNELNYEDLLISSLITISPQQVILHCTEQAQCYNTIGILKSVFGERLVQCPGCSRCLKPLQKS